MIWFNASYPNSFPSIVGAAYNAMMAVPDLNSTIEIVNHPVSGGNVIFTTN